MCKGDENVAGLLQKFYQTLFTSTNPSDMDEVTQHLTRVVTEEMNSDLIGDFTRAEVGWLLIK